MPSYTSRLIHLLEINQIHSGDSLRSILSQVFEDPLEDFFEYSEDFYANENQQAFLDAGHFYGLT